MASHHTISKFIRRADGLPVVHLEPVPETPAERAVREQRVIRQARLQEMRLWMAVIQLTGILACLCVLLQNPEAFLPKPLPSLPVIENMPARLPSQSDLELLKLNHQQAMDRTRELQFRLQRDRAAIEQVQEEALRTLQQARTSLDGRPIGSDERQMQVKLGDGRVLDNVEDAAAWLKRMASKLGTARLSLEDIDVLLETDDVDWVLSVSLPEEATPLRLALASRLWIVLLFTPADMRYVHPQNDDQTTGHGRIGLLFIVPRVPYDQRGERY